VTLLGAEVVAEYCDIWGKVLARGSAEVEAPETDKDPVPASSIHLTGRPAWAWRGRVARKAATSWLPVVQTLAAWSGQNASCGCLASVGDPEQNRVAVAKVCREGWAGFISEPG